MIASILNTQKSKFCNKIVLNSVTTILSKLTQILSWCASAAVKDFSGMLCETD